MMISLIFRCHDFDESWELKYESCQISICKLADQPQQICYNGTIPVVCFAELVDTKEVWREIYDNIKEERSFCYCPKYSNVASELSFGSNDIIIETIHDDEIEFQAKIRLPFDICKPPLLQLLQNLISSC